MRATRWKIQPCGNRKNSPVRSTRFHQSSPPPQKYFASRFPQIKSITTASRPTEGRFAIVTDVGAGCDGRESGARRALLPRTAKSCGSGAPTLALSQWYDPLMTVAKEPGHREELEGNR